MTPAIVETERLILRQWRESDVAPFVSLCADSEVMQYFPRTLSYQESTAMMQKAARGINEYGWGYWAAELKQSKKFIGFIGIYQLKPEFSFSPGIEIGWRLARDFWGKGLATEGAKRSLEFAFSEINVEEVLSFTTIENNRSQKVMQRIGMKNTGTTFLHPNLPQQHPLAEHVLYKITKECWLKR